MWCVLATSSQQKLASHDTMMTATMHRLLPQTSFGMVIVMMLLLESVSGISTAPQNMCIEQTKSILQATASKYEDDKVAISKSSVGGDDFEFLDFSTPSNGGNNKVYEKACGEYSGVYTTLDYTAKCTDAEGDEIGVYVKGHPSCYSSTCNDSGAETIIFDELTMHLTEERNPGWQCEGNLGVGNKFLSAGSSCELETKLINDLTDIIKVSYEIKEPKIETQKKWWLIPLKEQDVTVGTSKVFSANCVNQNGWYGEIKDTKIMCYVDGASEATGSPFEIKSFSVCLGLTCAIDGLDPVFKETAVASQFQAKMLDAGAVGSDMVCSITSGAGLVASLATLGMATSIAVLATSLLVLL
jgi:hypothetical protein